MLRSLVGSEMCIRDSINAEYGGFTNLPMSRLQLLMVLVALCALLALAVAAPKNEDTWAEQDGTGLVQAAVAPPCTDSRESNCDTGEGDGKQPTGEPNLPECFDTPDPQPGKNCN
eukprot:TRINITY_DN334_c0_g1_i3.p2 TRINITY_DN334_c0_g1~~TRINITY_DN334_c0_g1_i3.p2  ORF type:complete len:115 (-),score=37.24 TRINITY_DN334_c0_g1_i3:240-584(-)